MKRKDSQLLNKFQISTSTFLSDIDEKLFQDFLLNYYPDLSPAHIKYIQKSFEDYFDELIKINHNKIILDELTDSKNLIKTHFISKVMVRLSTDKLVPLFKRIDNADKYIQMRLEAYIDDFLFFVRITYDIMNGNIKSLKSKLQRRKRANKTNEECKEIIKLLIEGYSKYKAIEITATKFEDKEENVKSKFNNFCKTSKINWQLKNDLINALKILGTD